MRGRGGESDPWHWLRPIPDLERAGRAIVIYMVPYGTQQYGLLVVLVLLGSLRIAATWSHLNATYHEPLHVACGCSGGRRNTGSWRVWSPIWRAFDREATAIRWPKRSSCCTNGGAIGGIFTVARAGVAAAGVFSLRPPAPGHAVLTTPFSNLLFVALAVGPLVVLYRHGCSASYWAG